MLCVSRYYSRLKSSVTPWFEISGNQTKKIAMKLDAIVSKSYEITQILESTEKSALTIRNH